MAVHFSQDCFEITLTTLLKGKQKHHLLQEESIHYSILYYFKLFSHYPIIFSLISLCGYEIHKNYYMMITI